jgi:electron transfer flavoprotein beta subunit
MPPEGIPPVVNGFCENAVEAALKIKDSVPGTTVTVISIGSSFVLDVIKKPLSMGADQIILVEDQNIENADPFSTTKILSATIKTIPDFDLIICGQQASDWDNAHVPMGISETLKIPCLNSAKEISIDEETIIVKSSISDGYISLKSRLPALVTVNNEIGEPRYPTLKGIMQASRKTPEKLTLEDIHLAQSDISPKMSLLSLSIPISNSQCEILEGETDADSGKLLALKLREDKII